MGRVYKIEQPGSSPVVHHDIPLEDNAVLLSGISDGTKNINNGNLVVMEDGIIYPLTYLNQGTWEFNNYSFHIGENIYCYIGNTIASNTDFISEKFYSSYYNVPMNVNCGDYTDFGQEGQVDCRSASAWLQVNVNTITNKWTPVAFLCSDFLHGSTPMFVIRLGCCTSISSQDQEGYFNLEEQNPLFYYDGTQLIDYAAYLASLKQDKLVVRAIDGVNFDGTADIAHYARCGTEANVAAKTVTGVTGFKISGSQPVTGAQLLVNFTNGNTAASPTLSVNHSNPAYIKYRNGAVPSGAIAQNGLYLLVFDGTSWQISANLPESVSGSIKYGGTFSALTALADITVAAQTQLGLLSSGDTQIILINEANDPNPQTTPKKSFGYTSNVDIYYICQVAGTMFTAPDQIQFAVGDWIISNGNGWQKIEGNAGVFSGADKSSYADGSIGLVPKPKGDSTNRDFDKFLKGDGGWSYLNPAGANIIGGFKTGFQNNERQFGMKLSNEKGYVEVPLENNLAMVGFIRNTQHAIDSHCLCAVDTEGRMFSLFYKSGNNYYAEINANFPIGTKIYYYDGVERAAASQSGSFDSTYFYTTKLIDVYNEGLPHGFDGSLLHESKAIYIGVYLDDDNKQFSIVDDIDAIVTIDDMTSGTYYIRIGIMNYDGSFIQIEQENPLYYFDTSGNLVDYAIYLASLKQDKLNAGNNIQINGNTISATDTTYGVFSSSANGLVPKPTGNASGNTKCFLDATGSWSEPVGTTYSQYSGSDAGLVPNAGSGNTGKFLKNDGTWGNPTGTTYSAGNGININSNTISIAAKVWKGVMYANDSPAAFNSTRTFTLIPPNDNQINIPGLYRVFTDFVISSDAQSGGTDYASVSLCVNKDGSSISTPLQACQYNFRYCNRFSVHFEVYVYLTSGVLIPKVEVSPSNGYVNVERGAYMTIGSTYPYIFVEYMGVNDNIICDVNTPTP